MTPKPLTLKELRKYPASALKVDAPPATHQSRVAVAKDRGGPLMLHYELYGTGPIKILWLSGHGDGIEGFYNCVRRVGLDDSDRYTSLLLENRGIGRSESSWSFCTMTDLAKDALEVLDDAGWTESKVVNIVGHSMGGMIAMRMAVLDPLRIASLTLISTTSHWMNDFSLLSVSKTMLSQLLPKGEDARMADIKNMVFGQTWLNAPDERGIFPTNGDAWAAQFMRSTPQYKGAIVSGPACVRHQVSKEELRKITETIGGPNIQVLHGQADRIAPVSAAEKTIDGFGGSASGVTLHLFRDVGHALHFERLPDVIQLVKELTKSESTCDAG